MEMRVNVALRPPSVRYTAGYTGPRAIQSVVKRKIRKCHIPGVQYTIRHFIELPVRFLIYEVGNKVGAS
jgi:hypothetical protein